MEISKKLKDQFLILLPRWSDHLITRNGVRSTFSNSAGWRQYYTIFQRIKAETVQFQFSESQRTWIATYHFFQEHFITEPFPTEEAALRCDQFFLRNSNIHYHTAIYRNGGWDVYDRETESSTLGKKRNQCDRFVFKAGQEICVNDYSCRENEKIASNLECGGYVAPLEHRCNFFGDERPVPEGIRGGFHFKIYDLPDDPEKSVTITITLSITFKHGGYYQMISSKSSFLEYANCDHYRKPAKGKLKKVLLILLKSALYNTKASIEAELKSTAGNYLFPATQKELIPIFNQFWGEICVDYV